MSTLYVLFVLVAPVAFLFFMVGHYLGWRAGVDYAKKHPGSQP
jgi:hypothetical protein